MQSGSGEATAVYAQNHARQGVSICHPAHFAKSTRYMGVASVT